MPESNYEQAFARTIPQRIASLSSGHVARGHCELEPLIRARSTGAIGGYQKSTQERAPVPARSRSRSRLLVGDENLAPGLAAGNVATIAVTARDIAGLGELRDHW